MTALKITLQVIVVLLSFVLTLLILMQKNLNRWTVIIALVWVALIIGLDMMTKFNLG